MPFEPRVQYIKRKENQSVPSTRPRSRLSKDGVRWLALFGFRISRFRSPVPPRGQLLVQLVGFIFVLRFAFLTRHPPPSGDSYTQTGFKFNETQPSIGNPLGNPPYPVRPQSPSR